jgi:hypothetical protein
MSVSAETLEALLQAQRFQAGAWTKVIEKARAYGMFEATGSYMENGVRVHVSHSDRKPTEQYFADELFRAARAAFAEDALMGAALQSAKEQL